MSKNEKLRQLSTRTSVMFLSGILLTSSILMMIPSVEASEPQVQMWFSSKNSKDLTTFLDYEKYDGYGWEGKVNVMIWAPGWNEDPDKIETIGTSTSTPIGMSIRNSPEGNSGAAKSLSPCGFAETGPDTGLFYGRVKLSGTDVDTNGDGTTAYFGGSSCTNMSDGTTKPSHREAAKLESSQSGAFTVWWNFDGDNVISKTATYTMTEAEVEFSQEYYDTTDSVTINLTDSDMWNKGRALTSLWLYSDSDRTGITVEYDKKLNPQIVTLTTEESSGKSLYVQPGDTIYAEYDDYLMPPVDADGIEYDISICSSRNNCDSGDHKTILATAEIRS